MQRRSDLLPTAAALAKALRLCSTAQVAPPWGVTVSLLDDAVEHGLTLPRESQLHVLRAGLASGAGWDAVRQIGRLDFERGTPFIDESGAAAGSFGGTSEEEHGRRARRRAQRTLAVAAAAAATAATACW